MLEQLAYSTFIATCFVFVAWIFNNWCITIRVKISNHPTNEIEIQMVPASELKEYVDEAITEKIKEMPGVPQNWQL